MPAPTDVIRAETLNAHQYAALAELARRYDWQLVVLFGSTARGEVARDLDVAVQPAAVPDLFLQGRWFRELEELFVPQTPDLLVLNDATSPVARFEIFRDGICLYEAAPGTFDREQDRAFFLYADTRWLRQGEGAVDRDA